MAYMYLASSPGHSYIFNVTRRKRALFCTVYVTLKTQEWPGDEARHTYSFYSFTVIFLLVLQLFVYPWIAKRIGYRRTLICGLLLFGVMSVLFPFSNRITGPIGDGGDVIDFNSTTNGSVESDFCGHKLSGDDSDNLVNENSVSRIPVRVWSWLVFNLTLWIISRWVMIFYLCIW
jgi:MFS family permease